MLEMREASAALTDLNKVWIFSLVRNDCPRVNKPYDFHHFEGFSEIFHHFRIISHLFSC